MRSAQLLLCAMLAACQSTDVRTNVEVSPKEAKAPNIVFFFIDDLGWRDVGFMGSGYYETPRIDALAGSGVVFTNAYANAPNCAPSRACLMSGLYSPRHGVYTVGSAGRGKAVHRKLVPTKNRTDLDPSFVTLAETLADSGYATAHFGKWHLGKDPCSQGFHTNVGGNATGSPKGGYFSPYRNPQLENGPKDEYLTDRLTDEAIAFIDRHRKSDDGDKPFFLYLSHYAVHTPIQAKPDLTEKYRAKQRTEEHGNAKYAAMIDSVDQSVGRVLDKLSAEGIQDDTVVIFFSDNGGHGPVTSMKPLRGSKGMLYEGGIREPLVIAWPDKIEAGRDDTPVIGIDLYPTLVELAGAKPPKLDGQSLVPLLKRSGKLGERALHWHFPAYLQGNRRAGRIWRTTPAAAVRQGDLKLIEFFEDGRLELYDLATDIGEQRNLVDQRPDDVAALHAVMRSWREVTNAPIPTELNPKFDPNAGRR